MIFRLWQRSLLIQLVGSFSLLSLAIAGLVGYTAFRQAQTALSESVLEQLTAVASLKEAELNRWLRDRRNILGNFSRIPVVNQTAQTLLTTDAESPEYQAAFAELQAALTQFVGDGQEYEDIYLLSRNGWILASTQGDRINRYEPIVQTSQGFSEDRLIANVYRSPETNRPTITFSIPLQNAEGKTLGLLGVHLNLNRIDNIIRNNQGLGDTGETYLVANVGTSLSGRNVFVSASGFGSEEFPDGVTSPGIEDAVAGNDSQGLYRNYEDEPVLGVYHWLDNQNMALMVELTQAEAFAPARQLAINIGWVGTSLAGLLALGILLLGRRIVEPILAIAQTAVAVQDRVRTGDFDCLEMAPVLTDNEIGILARTFNQMTLQLKISYEQLQEYNHTLEAKVNARTQEIATKNKDLQETLAQLQTTQMQLIQNEKMASLGQMVAGIAHEINNPVNFIFGNLGHLEDYTENLLHLIELYHREYPQESQAIATVKEDIDLEFITHDIQKVLHSMHVGTTRIRDIVLSLRNFSRLDEADRKTVNLHEGIDSTLLILHNRLKAKSQKDAIAIIKEYGDIPPVECYPSQLNQVFLNLLSNAIDALETGVAAGKVTQPQIKITTTASNGQVKIAIADNGPGIPEAVRQKIFDPFFTTKAIGKGTGLGLSISYSIITDRHQGTLACYSQLGQGATFAIAIPS